MSTLLSSSDGCAVCQVSLDEGAGASVEDEVLQRAAGFFVDNNENYTVSYILHWMHMHNTYYII